MRNLNSIFIFVTASLFLAACTSIPFNETTNSKFEQQKLKTAYSYCDLLNEIPLNNYPVNSTIDTSQAYVVVGPYLEDNAWQVLGELSSRGASYVNGNASELVPFRTRTLIMPFDPLKGVSFRFREYSSHINFEINGNLLETYSLLSLNGYIFDSWFDSILVEIILDPTQTSEAYTGIINLIPLEGTITSFAIGGHALVIDDVCLDY